MIKSSENPLHGLSNKRRFANLLNISYKDLKALVKNIEQYYKVFKIHKGKKERIVQAPQSPLIQVHKRLKEYLYQLETPAYLYSKNGRSYVDNASAHRHNSNLLTADIYHFFQSCKRQYVFKFFSQSLFMSEDVAWLATKLTTFGQFLPTGSPTSPILSFWTYKKQFDEIARLAEERNINFTLYVDDLTFSFNGPIGYEFLSAVINIFRSVGLVLKNSKIKKYPAGKVKIVTGVAIMSDGRLEPPYKLRKKIFGKYKRGIKVKELDDKSFKSLLGRVRSARVIGGAELYPILYKNLRLREMESGKH